MKVVGIKEVNYTSKKTGQPVQGVEVHGTFPSGRAGFGTSHLTDVQFMSMQVIEKNGGQLPSEGDEINFFYNKYGKVEHYEIIPSVS